MNRIIFRLMIAFWCVNGIGQHTQSEYALDYISTEAGLPHNYVSKIVSDSLNVKWIAQETGVTRYDGQIFTKIEPGPEYPDLKNENIETLYFDSKNRLWIGTKSGGISMLDIRTNKLVNYNNIIASDLNGILRIISIEEDAFGNLWFGSVHNGLFVFNPHTKELIKKLPGKLINAILKDSNGNVWYASGLNLRRVDHSTGKVSIIRFDQEINSVIEDKSRNCLWIATYHSPDQAARYIYKLDLGSNEIIKVDTGIDHYYFKSMALDRFDRLWIGTWGKGVYRSNSTLNKFEKINLVNSKNSQKSINYQNIIDIHIDKNNVVWLATTFAGIVKLTESKGFENIDVIVENPILVNELNFQSVFRDDENIWLGTIQSGLFKGTDFNNLARVEVVENSKIYSINKYRDYVFVGTANNFYILDRNGKLLRIVELRKVTCTFFEGDQMWVGTQQLGLWKFDISDIFNPIQNSRYNIYGSHNKIESDRITTITKDYSGNLWIGTYNGLHKFDDETKRFVNQSEFFSGQMPKITNTLYVDNHFIWVGTPSGLYQLKYENDTLEIVKSFNDSNYLKNDFICGITKNNDNVMWLSTSNSIVKYNPNDQSFTHYGKNDGVGTSQFNLRSFYNFDHELILAGGVDNLTYFNPSEISDASIKSEIIITQFNVDNIDIVPGDSINGRILLNNAINYTDKITLTHKEKSLYLSFIKNNFRNDIKSNYRYRLIGHEEEWVDLNEKSELNFMGLGPGNYELQLSASDDGKNWVKPKILGVEVLYAPWLSPLAYSFYIVMLLLIIGTVIFLVMRELHERNKLKKEQELSESKFTFFTNISHEFRTPLTLILSPLKELNKSTQFDSKTTEKLHTMEKNANRLLNLINQLLDFRKADHGLLKLDVKPGNFVNFSKEVFLYFKELSATKQINYSFGAMQEEIIFPFDRNKMEIVICNLISNSLKFSAPGAKVKLKVSGTKSACIMVLEDTGQGMDRESKNRIFDRFYQINSTNTSDIIGSGLGLSFTKKIVELHDGTIDVESKVNKGTVFTLSFPITSGSRNPEYKPKRIEIETTSLFPKSNIDIEVPSNTLKVNARENTILIVDDNLEIRNYLNQLLNEDYNVISARDGVEAIEIASEEIPDLILCDIMMPRKDGLAVCKELKEQLNTSHIPILLLTARSANLFEIKSLDTGADDFITKPFDPDIVKARISSALKNRLKLREHFLNKVRFEPSVSNSQNKDSETLFIERLVQLVEENLMNDQFGIESIMAILHMSQSTLYRKIKSLTGLSLTAFIRSIRIKKAAEIILTENEKLKTVSLLVGFNDYKHFSESFKKQFGCLPSEYKSVKKDNSL